MSKRLTISYVEKQLRKHLEWAYLTSEIYLEIDYIEIDNTDDSKLITLKGRYGIYPDDKDREKHYNFEIQYTDFETMDFIRGKFDQVVQLNEERESDDSI